MLSAARYLSPGPGAAARSSDTSSTLSTDGQLPRLGAELHVPLHLLAPAGHPEEEPQRHDPGVVGRWRDPGIGHVKLIGAKLLRRRRVRRAPQKRGEILDRPNMRLLRLCRPSRECACLRSSAHAAAWFSPLSWEPPVCRLRKPQSSDRSRQIAKCAPLGIIAIHSATSAIAARAASSTSPKTTFFGFRNIGRDAHKAVSERRSHGA